MTQNTTALGVSGTSMYIHQPVKPSATAICKEHVSACQVVQDSISHTITAPLRRITRRPQRSTRTQLRIVISSVIHHPSIGRASSRRKCTQNVDDRVDAGHENGISTNPSGLCWSSIRTVNLCFETGRHSKTRAGVNEESVIKTCEEDIWPTSIVRDDWHEKKCEQV